MKTRHFQMMATLAVGMAMTCVTMTSCAKEDNPVNDEPEFDEEQEVPEVLIDDLTRFKAVLYIPDTDGNPTDHLKLGKATHPESPKDYYISASSVEHAKKLFLSFMALDIDRAEDGNNIILDLKDEKGRGQGFVYFTEASEQRQKEGILAEVTFSPDLHIDGIDRFVFVREIQDYYGNRFLEPFRIKDSRLGNPTGLCIKDFYEGIIIVLADEYSGFKSCIANTSEWDMYCIGCYIQNMNMREDVDRKLKELGLGELDDDYWASDVVSYFLFDVKYTFNFATFKKRTITAWDPKKKRDRGKNFLSYWWYDEEGFRNLVFEPPYY